jgi:hypothetical protein
LEEELAAKGVVHGAMSTRMIIFAAAWNAVHTQPRLHRQEAKDEKTVSNLGKKADSAAGEVTNGCAVSVANGAKAAKNQSTSEVTRANFSQGFHQSLARQVDDFPFAEIRVQSSHSYPPVKSKASWEVCL